MALTDNLVSVWKMDEASGTRVDSFGSNNLTDNNTVTQAGGKLNNAAQFTRANSEWLSHTDNSDLSWGDRDRTFSAWVYMDSKASDQNTIIAKMDFAAGDTREFEIMFTGSANRFEFIMRNASGVSHTVQANNFGAPSTATWYFIVAAYDAAADLMQICVNDGTLDTLSHAGGTADTATDFTIGRAADATAWFWDGRIDYVCMWNRVITSSEITQLYNSGNGYDFLSTTPQPSHMDYFNSNIVDQKMWL